MGKGIGLILGIACAGLLSCGAAPIASSSVISSSESESTSSKESSSSLESLPSISSEETSSSAQPTLRESIVSYMRAMATLEWTPSVSFDYYESTGSDGKKYQAETTYLGLPYTMEQGRTSTLGDPLNLFKAKLDSDGKTYVGSTGKTTYYGSDCSSSVEGAWRQNGFVTNAVYTGAMIPGENAKISAIGGYSYDDRSKMTRSIVEKNGEQKMSSAYAELKAGDAVVRRVPSGSGYAGHVRLVAGVDPERKTVTVIEQCGWGIDSQTKTSWRVDKVYSFNSLYANYYIPIRPVGLSD